MHDLLLLKLIWHTATPHCSCLPLLTPALWAGGGGVGSASCLLLLQLLCPVAAAGTALLLELRQLLLLELLIL